jgi:hypothetical protein
MTVWMGCACLSAAAATPDPGIGGSVAAVACVNAAPAAEWSAAFATNVAEVTFGALATDRALEVSILSVDGTVASETSPAGMMAWAKARFDASASGASVEIGRVSGTLRGTGADNVFGVLAWSDAAFADNPATVRIGRLDGIVSANAGPGGAAAAVCARTAVDLTLAPGAVLFGGTYGWDAGDGSATNAAAALQTALERVKARTATAAESNALAAAASEGYAVWSGAGDDIVRLDENVAVFGTVALGEGLDTVSVSGVRSNAAVRLPVFEGAERLVVTNSPDVAVSNAAGFAELAVGAGALCRLQDGVCVFPTLSGSGAVVPRGLLTVTGTLDVGGLEAVPVGAVLTVAGGLTLGDGVVCRLRAAEAGGPWTNDAVDVGGALTVAGGGTVDLGCTPEAPFALHTRRVVMTAAGGIVNPGALAGWTLTGTGRDGDAGLVMSVKAVGNQVVVGVSRGGTLISVR